MPTTRSQARDAKRAETASSSSSSSSTAAEPDCTHALKLELLSITADAPAGRAALLKRYTELLCTPDWASLPAHVHHELHDVQEALFPASARKPQPDAPLSQDELKAVHEACEHLQKAVPQEELLRLLYAADPDAMFPLDELEEILIDNYQDEGKYVPEDAYERWALAKRLVGTQ
ncbi:hypothetical protein PsYK624_042000 [Phanerochaete sordida]|uniref:Uncharacterized protein n=1 Tax=Phanerochaete sordida TaxID=48140 RepID=A0A9P3G2Z9_9APHY|nr:hypothetical protein PsYK624_042000 [Phanerochaete sordida]